MGTLLRPQTSLRTLHLSLNCRKIHIYASYHIYEEPQRNAEIFYFVLDNQICPIKLEICQEVKVWKDL